MPNDLDRRLETFFEGRTDARTIFDAVRGLIESLGAVTIRVTKSQVAFSRRRAFAWAWTPDRYLRGDTAPLVLSLALPRRDESPRWKEVVEPRPGRWMHHLELRSTDELDDEMRARLSEAWDEAR